MWSHAKQHVEGLRAKKLLCQKCYEYGHYAIFCPNPRYFGVGEEEESYVGAYSQGSRFYDDYPIRNSPSRSSWKALSPSMHMQNQWTHPPQSYPCMESRTYHNSPPWPTDNHHIHET